MTEFNACFVSYRHPNDPNAQRFVQAFVEELRALLKLWLPNARIFFDEDGIQVGDRFNEELARELCRSACLVICYGPRHFDSSHPYCTREYLAMRLLEDKRRKHIFTTSGLIFPVVFRGFESLLAEILDNRHYINFDDVVQPSDFRSRRRRQKISDLALQIFKRCEELERSGVFAKDDCSRFRFAIKKADNWLKQNAGRARPPMPGR